MRFFSRTPGWVEKLPQQIHLSESQIKTLERIRKENKWDHNQFLTILDSLRAMTNIVLKCSYYELKRKYPEMRHRELLKTLIIQRMEYCKSRIRKRDHEVDLFVCLQDLNHYGTIDAFVWAATIHESLNNCEFIIPQLTQNELENIFNDVYYRGLRIGSG